MPAAILVFRNLTNPSLDRLVSGSFPNLVVNTYQALTLDYSINTNLETVVYSPFVTSVSTDRGVNTSLESLSPTTYQVSFGGSKAVETVLTNVSTTTYQATISQNNRSINTNLVSVESVAYAGFGGVHNPQTVRNCVKGTDGVGQYSGFLIAGPASFGSVDNQLVYPNMNVIQVYVATNAFFPDGAYTIQLQPTTTINESWYAIEIVSSLGTAFLESGRATNGAFVTGPQPPFSSGAGIEWIFSNRTEPDVLTTLEDGDSFTIQFYA